MILEGINMKQLTHSHSFIHCENL